MEPVHRKRHYGRRKGWKLRPHQAQLVETLLPKLTLVPKAGLDPREYFDRDVDDVWLEVGFGAGEHLAWQAEHNPGVGIIGAEPFVAGMAKLLSKIAAPSASLRSAPPPVGGERNTQYLSSPVGGGPAEGRGGGLSNIRIYPEDATDVIDALPDASLGRVFVLFPDPWPKTRHHKRRFLQTALLDELARVMRSGAELRFATDDNGYLVWALERFMAHPAFVWTAQSPAGWRARPPDWPETRYEQKALHGKPVYLRFIRRSPFPPQSRASIGA